MKGTAAVETFSPRALAAYARLCGWTLARAHARSGDAVAIASYLGSGRKFDEAITTFAERYADQNEADYRRFCAAIEEREASKRPTRTGPLAAARAAATSLG